MVCTSILTTAVFMNYSFAVLRYTGNIVGHQTTSLKQNQCHNCNIGSTSKDLAGKNNGTNLESILQTLIEEMLMTPDLYWY